MAKREAPYSAYEHAKALLAAGRKAWSPHEVRNVEEMKFLRETPESASFESRALLYHFPVISSNQTCNELVQRSERLLGSAVVLVPSVRVKR